MTWLKRRMEMIEERVSEPNRQKDKSIYLNVLND